MAVRKHEKRKRAYIPFPERLAAALAMLLPADQRDTLRAARAPAKAVLRLWQFDHHPILHTHGGPDLWWNLTPIQKRPHIEKTKVDRKVIAKVDRIIAKEAQHEEARRRVISFDLVDPKVRKILERPKRKYQWPKRKIASRPFRRPCV